MANYLSVGSRCSVLLAEAASAKVAGGVGPSENTAVWCVAVL